MKPPIVADCRGDVFALASVADAESYIEPFDVLDNLYEVFDSEGLRLKIQVVLKGRRERVVLRPGAPAAGQAERLRKVLLDMFAQTSIALPDDVEECTLAHLIDLLDVVGGPVSLWAGRRGPGLTASSGAQERTRPNRSGPRHVPGDQ